jgi:hypothetical protein
MSNTICSVVSNSGPDGEPLACGFPEGHDGAHSWATLPTFTREGNDLKASVAYKVIEFVYVVIAWDAEKERVGIVNVLTDLRRAYDVFGELKLVYGGANVCLASRKVDDVNLGAPIRPWNGGGEAT